MTSPASRIPRLAAAVLFVSASLALVAPACSNSNAGSTLATEQACTTSSQCQAGLTCALGKCRSQCATAASCGAGGSCIDNGMIAICESSADYNTPCGSPSDCPSPLACASDYRCRNLCTTSADCNVFGITGRVCAVDANGVHYCADPNAETNGMITASPPPGAPGGPVTEPMLDASSDGGGDGAIASDGPVSNDSAMLLESGKDSTTGGEAGATCSPACGAGFACVNGSCAACGALNAPCCGTTCGANLTCDMTGKCACGNPGQECCNGTMCNGGISCVMGSCACGGAGQACCPPSGDAGIGQCTAPLQCAGAKCSCLVDAELGLVRRTDGTLWEYNLAGSGAPSEIMSNGSPLLATGADVGSTGSSFGNFACAVSSGNVWCWGGNTYGTLGNGTTTDSTTPVEVITAPPPGPALSNVSSLSAGGYMSCAVDKAGHVWCWGTPINGALGAGGTAASTFAVEVLTQTGGPAFSGAKQVSAGIGFACAVKTDGTLWCWGSNCAGTPCAGNLGVGSTSTPYLFPVQVTSLFSNVQSVDATGQSGPVCALLNDTSVWCWGDGPLGNGVDQPSGVPVQVVTSPDGGAPFSGVVQLAGVVCALKADTSVWCWNNGTSAQSAWLPAQATEGGFPVYAYAIGKGGDYIDRNGVANLVGSPVPAVYTIACP